MEAQYEKARIEDYDDVIDFGNYVFSQAHRPHDFPALLPKLYKREYFVDGIHYLAREGGKVKAAVGAYPLEWEFPGVTLHGRGIGMVSVHPYSRSRGYMKALMKMALEDIRRDGLVFSCLSGQRQRYEHFGFGLGGSTCTFTVNEANIQHTLGPQWTTGLSLKALGPEDNSLLDSIQILHETKAARMHRPRERLFDILTSWKAQVFALTEANQFAGYLIAKGSRTEKDRAISEINLEDLSRLPEALGLFLSLEKAAALHIDAGPQEGEKLTALSRFAEEYSLGPAYQFAVFDYRRFIEPFLRLRARAGKTVEGSVVLQIDDSPAFQLSVKAGHGPVPDTAVPDTASPPDLRLTGLEALNLLFSPLAARTTPAVRDSPFLQSLLPLPLFFESADGI